MATAQDPVFDWDAFREYMRRRRKQLSLTQGELAAIIGRRQPDVSAMEKGQIRPNSVDTFLRLADALQVSPVTLFKNFRK